MNVADLVRTMERIAPTRFAAPWDNVGLLVGDESSPLRRALLTIDCTRAVVDEAIAGRFDAVVAYHPPIFEAAKRFVAGSVAYSLARAGVALFSPHTALDVVDGGTNDVLARALGIVDPGPLRPVESAAPPGARLGPDAAIPAHVRGLGRVGAIAPACLGDVVASVKRALGVSHVLVSGSVDRTVSRGAVAAGSGGDLVPDALAQGAEVLLTGEVRHHDALRAQGAGLSIIALLHSVSERCALPALQLLLASALPDVAFVMSETDRDPFAFA
jgi:dinuclear metal center YbgI/SA1388 family protein